MRRKIGRNLALVVGTAVGMGATALASPIETFVSLNGNTNATADSIKTYAPPAGYAYSAAAPIAVTGSGQGDTWNNIRPTSTLAAGATSATIPGDGSITLDDAFGNMLTGVVLSLSVTDTAVGGTTHAYPATAAGDNLAQPGGVMSTAWRDYNNGGGSGAAISATAYYTASITGLADSTVYDIYFYMGTTTSGQGGVAQLAAVNQDGSNPTLLQLNDTQTATVYNTSLSANVTETGSIFDDGGTNNGTDYSLVSGGPGTAADNANSDWGVLVAETDGSGNLTFNFGGTGPNAYFNGFQIVDATLVPEPATGALVVLAGMGIGNIRFRRRGMKV